MNPKDFKIFPHLNHDVQFKKIMSAEEAGLKKLSLGSREFLEVPDSAIAEMIHVAFKDVSHLLRSRHLEKLSSIIDDPEASKNDIYVAKELLKNAVIAAKKVFPSCQDTGTAIVMAKKGQEVLTSGDDHGAISEGIFKTYTEGNLRYSQMAPLSMYEEKNTGCNLPAQIDTYSVTGQSYDFLCIAKGGGSANKTYLYQETKALLNPLNMETFVKAKLSSLGTAACPPYHLALVIGGTSAELNLKTVKLASAGYLDSLPTEGSVLGHAFRDLEMEERVLQWSRETKIGAQFGGKYFCHDVRVIRLPRHGASCPVGLGVSCSADRNIVCKINSEGVFVEELETNPAKYLKESSEIDLDAPAENIDLNQPMDQIIKKLSRFKVSTRLMLNGPMIVARDIAHAKISEKLKKEGSLPEYMLKHPVYYAGPAKTPEGKASGSFGPTTAGRMDPYVDLFQSHGGSLIMVAKGNRSKQVTDACQKHGGFYLGSIGGAAARLGQDCIEKVEVIDYHDLGMEAVHKIIVKDFPAFIIVDDKGNDFFTPSK